jgi:replication protein
VSATRAILTGGLGLGRLALRVPGSLLAYVGAFGPLIYPFVALPGGVYIVARMIGLPVPASLVALGIIVVVLFSYADTGHGFSLEHLGKSASSRDGGLPEHEEEPRRHARQRLRAHLWAMLPPDQHRVSRCGRARLAPSLVVALAADGSAHFRGLVTCGSVSACPCCAAKVRQARAEEIDRALGRHLAAGGGAVFVTLTAPHDAGMPLEKVWNTISGAWAALVAGRHRKALRERFGVIGYVRAVEVTHGRAGWHPHLHVLLLVEDPLDLDDLRELHRFLRERWGRRVTAAGFREPGLHRGVRVLPIYSADGVGGYLTKLAEDEGPGRTPGLELARSDLKTGRSWGSRAPFRILADHERDRRPSDWRLFEEWLHVSKGRRTLEWSRHLRARLLPDEQERTDEDRAVEGDAADEVAVLEAGVWVEVVRRGLNVAVLAAVEAHGLGGLVVLLRAAGLDAVAAREGPRVVVGLDDGEDAFLDA